jgi:hypothetical protein
MLPAYGLYELAQISPVQCCTARIGGGRRS